MVHHVGFLGGHGDGLTGVRTMDTPMLLLKLRGHLMNELTNGEIVAALTGWQAVVLASIAFAIAALVGVIRRRLSAH
jgi:hypothetical protein